MAAAETEKSPAYPVGTVTRTSTERDLQALGDVLKSHDARRIVIGLPLNMDGAEGPQARASRAFGTSLAAAFGIPIEYHDERLTSFEAEDLLGRRRYQANPGKGRRIKRIKREAIDAMAATLILQDWLDATGTRDRSNR